MSFSVWTVLTPSVGLQGPLRIIVGALMVFFLPGYALVVALFPRQYTEERRQSPPSFKIGDDRRAVPTVVTGLERFVLSVGLSLCTVPLIGLALNSTPIEFTEINALLALGEMTLALSIIALVRWARVPPTARFRALTVSSVAGPLQSLSSGTDRTEVLLNTLLVIGLILASSGVAFAVLDGENGEQFTEFYLLSEDPESGEFVSGNYPSELTPDGETEVRIGIVNQEDQTVEYTVVILLQDIDTDGGPQPAREREIDRFSTTLEAEETWEESRAIRPALTGEELRVTYLLYTGVPPGDPGTENAYRHVHIWVSASGGGSGAAMGGEGQ